MKPKSKVWMYVLAGILVVGILFTSASFAAGVQSLPSSIEESIIVFAPHPDGGALGVLERFMTPCKMATM